MRKLGLIGGMSWISTRTYYEQINRLIQRRHGPRASAPLVIDSLDYREVSDLEGTADWSRVADILSASAKRLEGAGAGAIVITANVMHKVFDEVAAAVSVPLLHIADGTANKMRDDGVKKAALLGNRSVMTEDFISGRLKDAGVELLPPKAADIDALDRIISEELKLGKGSRSAERLLKTMITIAEQEGARAVVLACTELELVVDVDANVLPIYDTALIQCRAAADWICDEDC